MEEQGFKETIEDMASGAIELDMDSIYVFLLQNPYYIVS